MSEPSSETSETAKLSGASGLDAKPDDAAELVERLEDLAEKASGPELESFVETLPPQEAALVLSRLPEESQILVLEKVSPETAASLVEQIPESQAVDVLERLEPQTAAEILSELPSDSKADYIAELETPEAEAILEEMDPREAAEARTLSRYPDDVAGGLMVTEVLSYPERFTVADVLDDLRAHAETYRDYVVQYAYVIGPDERLQGVLRLRDLLLQSPARPIREIQFEDLVTVRDTAGLDELRALFDRHAYYGFPVVDARGRLLGVVQRSAVHEAIGEKSEEDFLKAQGIVGGEELRSMPLLRRSGRRLGWLSANILLNVLAASVIAFYQDTLQTVIALAVFLPIISDMSGCAGHQAVAVSIRELSLGVVRPSEVLRVWLKEVSVGALNGLVLGGTIALIALLWKSNPYLGFVVGAALALDTLVAVSVGGCLPLVLKRFRMDPALASGPILTTVTDMCGFFFALSFATLLLSRLSGSAS